MYKTFEERFFQFIEQQELFGRGDKLLLACSGGSDSMLLAKLLLELGYNFSIAHANFQLRGEESELDEKLVCDFCEKNSIPFYLHKFSKEESLQKGESTQMWARRVRYDWFHELLMDHQFNFLLTAHHADDSLETFMMQFLRGITPFTYPGIRYKRDYVRRPLLFAKKIELLQLAEAKKIAWREDKSNQNNDYERNKMRNAILPLLKQYRGDSEEQLFSMLEEMQQKHHLWMKTFDEFAKKIKWNISGNLQTLEFDEHKENHMLFWYLYSSLTPLGFQSSQIEDIFKGLSEQKSGLLFYANDMELLLNRDNLLLRKKIVQDEIVEIILSGEGDYDFQGMKIKCKIVKEKIELPIPENVLYLDKSKFDFPFTVRNPIAGERMQPFGLKGTKKISDILVDKKVDRFAKEKTFVLSTKGGEVLWLLGLQRAELTRSNLGVEEIIKIEFLEEV